jgi:hypothetical protein
VNPGEGPSTLEQMNVGRTAARSWLTVTTEEQAALLTEPRTAHWIHPFLAREQSATLAAEAAGTSLETMLYRIRRLTGAGLLTVTRSEHRGGRPVKHYRSVADAFFVPFHLTSFAGLEESLEAQAFGEMRRVFRARARLMRESRWLGRRIYRDADSEEVSTETSSDPHVSLDLKAAGVPAAFDVMGDMFLSYEEARQLQRDLADLWQRYRHPERRSGQVYNLQVALTPISGE